MKNIKLILSIISPIAFVLIVLYLFLYIKGGIAFDFGKTEYAEVTAECVSVSHDTEKGADHSLEGRANDKDQYSLIYNYAYSVAGINYQASERYKKELDDYQSYLKDIEDSQQHIGHTKTLYYNPKKPEQYSFSDKNFDESVSSTNWVIRGMVVLCIAAAFPSILFMVMLTSFLRKRRK